MYAHAVPAAWRYLDMKSIHRRGKLCKEDSGRWELRSVLVLCQGRGSVETYMDDNLFSSLNSNIVNASMNRIKSTYGISCVLCLVAERSCVAEKKKKFSRSETCLTDRTLKCIVAQFKVVVFVISPVEGSGQEPSLYVHLHNRTPFPIVAELRSRNTNRLELPRSVRPSTIPGQNGSAKG